MTTGLASTATANAFLTVFRGGGNSAAFSAVTTPFVQIHTADPGAAGTTGVSAGSTTRNAVAFAAASAGSMSLSSLSAWTNGGTSETISHLGIWGAATTGTFYWSGALTTPQAWVSTNTLTITTLTLSITPIAA